jgi:hypothetical protein
MRCKVPDIRIKATTCISIWLTAISRIWYLDEKLCALDAGEKTTKETVYSSGLYLVIVYKAGKVSLMKKGVYVGDLH